MHILTKKLQVFCMSKKTFFRGTFLLTCAGLLSRIMGFFYRIFLSHTIGAEGIGLFQLVLPLQTLLLSITSSGIQTALSRLIAAHFATGEHKKARDFFCLGTLLAFLFSCVASSLLFLKADFFAVQILRSTYRRAPAHSCFQPAFGCSSFLYQQLLFCPQKSRFSIRHAVC